MKCLLFLFTFIPVLLFAQDCTDHFPYGFNPADAYEFHSGKLNVTGAPAENGTNDYFAAIDPDGNVVGCGVVDPGPNNSLFASFGVYSINSGTPVEVLNCNTECEEFSLVYYDDSEGLYYGITDDNGNLLSFPLTSSNGATIDGFGSAQQLTATPMPPNTTISGSTIPALLAAFEGILPVSFTSFTGRQQAKAISLNWATAVESGNERFFVERSKDGALFLDIGQVAGAGNSQDVIYYDFIDEQPQKGANYYRLRQNDFDGNVGYSSVLFVDFQGGAAGAMNVSPNPAANFLTVQLSEGWSTESINGKLIEANGRLLKDWQQRPGTSMTIDLAGVPAGVYQLVATDGNTREVKRIIVR